ncbi:MAG: hypothetical protein ACYC7D_13325 [Nitrososphaerales archaeon]
MSLIPSTFEGVVGILLLLLDGFLFGVAAKKAVTSVILIIVGLLLAVFVGIVVPYLTVTDIWTHLASIISSQASHIGAIFYAFPLFWIIGFALGIWKG